MPIVHTETGFAFTIEAKDKAPPKVHAYGVGKKYILVRIGEPEQSLPHILTYRHVSHDDLDLVFDTVVLYQANFLAAWKRIHGEPDPAARSRARAGTRQRTEPRVMPGAGRGTGARPTAAPAPASPRLRLKPRANKGLIKECLGGIADRRFYDLQRLLVQDIDGAGFKTIDLALWLRLGRWSHAGGNYVRTRDAVRALCEALFGYRLPARIGGLDLRTLQARSATALARIAPKVTAFHEKRLTAKEP